VAFCGVPRLGGTVTEHDPFQRAVDGATLTLDAYQAGQLEALQDALRDFETLAADLRRRITNIESRRSEGLFVDPGAPPA
jgi:hypothetical protein